MNKFNPESITNNPTKKDERIWNLKPDDNGNSVAVIRFLPRPEGDQINESYDYNEYLVRQITHYYKRNSKVYNEISRRTWEESDPVTDYNNAIYDKDQDLAKKIVYCPNGSRRRVSYYSNIYVINDVLHPENNGKVFIYRFGPMIMDKLIKVAKPEVPTKTPMNPFNIFNGPNFELISSKSGEFISYKDSIFQSSPSALSDNDELLETIIDKCYSLKEFIDIGKMKSYEELERKFIDVVGTDYYLHTGKQRPVREPAPTLVEATPQVATLTPKAVESATSSVSDVSDDEFENWIND